MSKAGTPITRTLTRRPEGRHGGGKSRPDSRVLLGLAAIFVLLAAVPTSATTAFDLDTVAALAEKLAAESPQEPAGRVPEWLLKISYDQWRDIRFRPERALWGDRPSPFQVQFFHPGLFYDRTVAVNVVEADGVRRVGSSPSQFDYGQNDFASRVPQDLGYAGLRIHYPINTASYFDEVIVFLGATYFRAVGRHQGFGQSARGLAVDTAESSGEEFPYFREFWLVSPAPKAREIALYALLDSRSLTGAYRFVVAPGEQTVVAVDCRLFFRRQVKKLGIAPLTSMFFHGENTTRHFEDFRPEVHDSDGVLLSFGSGEWLWRPIDNPAALHVSGLEMENPRGFGLAQRDRVFDHYQDLETRPQSRPSVWIQPSGDWGRGRVEVVEIPTDSDSNDNIVVYWMPEAQPKPGVPASFSYRMYWYGDDPNRPPGGRAVATRQDRGTVEDGHRFVIDFEGKRLERIPAERVVRGVVTIQGGEDVAELLDQQVVKNPATGGWRLTFQVRPKKRGSIELRAFLDQAGEALTETWSYAILP